MQVTERKTNINNSTLNHLILELKEECEKAISLINQLELSNLTDRQKSKILSELLVSSIYLDSHCNKDFQDLISDELETLHDE